MKSSGIGPRVAAMAAACLATAALSACSIDASAGKSVKEADVEKQISDQLAANRGQTPKSVTCPGDLKATKGTTMRCTLTDSADKKVGFTLSVTSVENNMVNFNIKLDDKPMP